MSVPFIQPSFAAGELAPSLYGRVDLGKHAIGLSTCRNLFVNLRGGAYSRAGTAFAGFSKQTGRTVPPRMVTFQFSINQGLALEFGNQYMRVVSNGAFVTETATNISGITRANPGVITDNAHGYSNGDWVYLFGIGGMTQLNGQTLVVAGKTTNTYTLTDVYGNAIDTTAFSAYTAGGTASRIFTLATPYAEADIPWLKWTQSADTMSLVCWNQMTGTEYQPYDLARQSDASWTLTAFGAGAVISPPAYSSGFATVLYGGTASPKPTDYQYVFTAVDFITGQESVASPIADIPNSADIALTAGSIVTSCAPVAGAAYYNVYKAPPAYAASVPSGSLFGYVGTTYGTQFVDSNIVADYTQVPPLHQDPFAPGQILYAVITNPGSGLSAVTWAITSVDGTGDTAFPVIVGGQLVAFVFTDGGKNFAPGDTIAFNGAGFAGGAITFTANPTAGDTVTLNSSVWTFVSAITGAAQTLIQGTLAATLQNLSADLATSVDPNLVVANYVPSGTALNITYKTAGAGGDSYTLDASAANPTGTAATGNLLFGGGNPSNTQTIVLNGVNWTFVTSGAAGNQTNIKGTLALTLAQLVTDLTASVVAGISVATYTNNATRLFVTYNSAATRGDAYTLGGGTSGATPSGATLAGAAGALAGGGGTSGTNPAATLIVGPVSGTYPSAVAYFQERRVYASSPNNPDTYWMSQPGAFQNFDSRVPTVATDAITGTPWSVQVNGIQFMVPMPGGLVVLTGLEAWQLTGAGGSSLNPQPITPASQQAQPQAYNGCDAQVPPIKIDYDINYIQAKGSLLRDLSYNFWANIYTGTDLTYLSPHLFLGYKVREMAWCEEPYRLIWATRNDGILLSLSYFKQQDVMGWARHDTNGQFWSVCSVTEPPVDALYLCSQRYLPKGNAYLIERMDNRIWAANENTWCVDAGLTTALPQPAASLTASSSRGAGIPTGITGLVGGAGYSAGTTAVLQDPTGTGAVVTPTIAGGVVTGIAIAGGTKYSYPVLQFIDPAGTGSGASATITLDNSATFKASAGVFSGGMVGQVIRMGGGRATVTVYNSATQVTANITSPIVATIPNSGGIPAIAASGNWSIAPNITTIGGLWHLEGATVTGIADGLPFAPQIVSAAGTITLATPASLITVGMAFTPQMQSLYLDTGSPTIQAQRGKLAAVSVRLEASGVGSILVGANQPDGAVQSPPVVDMPWGILPASPLTPLKLPPDQNLAPFGSAIIPLYTGDVRVPVGGGFAKPKQVALQQTQPLPMQVLALIPEFLPGDLPEETARPEAQQGDGGRKPAWGAAPAGRHAA